MRIDSTNMEMGSVRRYSSYTQRNINYSAYRGFSGFPLNGRGEGSLTDLDAGAAGKDAEGEKTRQTAEERNKGLKEKLEQMRAGQDIGRLNRRESGRSTFTAIQESCMDYLIMLLFGKKRASGDNGLPGYSMGGYRMITQVQSVSEQTFFEEKEATSFSAAGTVKCADGREINFRMDVGMSRSFHAYYEKNYTMVQTGLCDPLVINLDGNVAQLEDQKFFFDLDADGTEEEISMLGPGSGYLALDKNGDGVINDGSELFGTKSGDGFADLAAWDSDGNGWIDEGDEVFDRLLIWTKDENGKDVCCRLRDKNVGAICLKNCDTGFSLNASDNSTKGVIRKTAVFLYENGTAGTVQHLDLAN